MKGWVMCVLVDELFVENIGKKIVASTEQVSEVVIVSPFVKEAALKKLLLTQKNICSLNLITKAVILDFATGVSDISVWSHIWGLGGNVLVNNSLHAKYIRFDSTVYLGSANVTDSGLGYSTYPNVELMLKKQVNEDFIRFERKLIRSSYIATEADYQLCLQKIDSLIDDKEWKKSQTVNRRCYAQFAEPSDLEWIPLCLDPGLELWPTYCGIANYVNALDVIESLRIPVGIKTESEFRDILGLMVSKLNLTKKIHYLFDHNSTKERPFISFGTLKHQSNIKWDRRCCNDQINATMSLLEYALPRDFYYEPPKTWSRLLGRRY